MSPHITPVRASELRTAAHRDDRTGPWFDALADGILTLRRCTGCGHTARPDAASCPACHSADLAWASARGTGRVVSRVVDHAAASDGDSPLTLGLVELDEGPWLHTRLLDDSAIGDPVTLTVLVPDDGGEPVPAFRRA